MNSKIIHKHVLIFHTPCIITENTVAEGYDFHLHFPFPVPVALHTLLPRELCPILVPH